MPTDTDTLLDLNRRERLELIDAVSRERGVAPVIIEKDYWVCRTLDALFSLPGLAEHLVFKGGTSLSKVYRLIDRFSEDIDVSFHREFLGFGNEQDPESATGKKRNRRLDQLRSACEERVHDTLLPSLTKRLFQLLAGESDWSLAVDPQDNQTILFRFPQSGASELAYIAPTVRIELGARSDHWPSETHEIRSYIGETIGRPFGRAEVRVLAAERTFWEKATILHAECHREADKPMPARYARHYYDLARMAAAPVADRALAGVALRQRVVQHKSVYFRSAWANYDLAVPPTFRLVPPPERLRELEADHEAMKQMFFTRPPEIPEILATLSALEKRICALPE
ncbi:MAG: nucleotidyl transferase AbiEii/AbiGii toxin family protein [Opitutales bacterium]